MSEQAEHQSTAPALRWMWRDEQFAQLMLGRIQIAQISRTTGTRTWFYTMYHVKPGERSTWSEPTQAEAMAACEEHARKVLADG